MAAAQQDSTGWRIGRIGRTPLYLDRSWPIGVLILASLYYTSLVNAGNSTAISIGLALVATIGLFASVLIHEVSHGLAGRATGRPPVSYTLTLWGGYTAFKGPERGPGVMALIALAGPLTNIAVGLALGQVVLLLDGGQYQLLGAFLWPLSVVNIMMGAFNLAPGLPLDGGHAVHALAWKITGNRDRGMLVGAWAGVILAAAVTAWGIVELIRPASGVFSSSVWLLLIGVFMGSGALQSLRVARARLAATGIDLRAYMLRVPVISAHAPIAYAQGGAVVVDAHNRILGIIQPGYVAGLDPQLQAHAALQVIHPTAVLPTPIGADALAALQNAGRSGGVVVVMDQTHAWMGRVADMSYALSTAHSRGGVPGR